MVSGLGFRVEGTVRKGFTGVRVKGCGSGFTTPSTCRWPFKAPPMAKAIIVRGSWYSS